MSLTETAAYYPGLSRLVNINLKLRLSPLIL